MEGTQRKVEQGSCPIVVRKTANNGGKSSRTTKCPTREDGTLVRATGTLQSLEHWWDIHAGILQQSMGKIYAILGTAARQKLGNGSTVGYYRYTTIENVDNKRKFDDVILMVFIDSICGHPV